MAIVVESISTTGWSLRSTLTLTKPTGTVDGDLLIAIVADEGSDSTPPSGWTLIKLQSVSGPVSALVYSKIASSEPASWDWQISYNNCAGGVFRISGHSPTTPVYTSEGDSVSDSTAPVFTNSITPSSANSLILFVAVSRQSGGNVHTSHAITTSNPSWTTGISVNNSQNVLSTVYAIRPETTATGDSSLVFTSSSSSADTVAILLAIQPQVNMSIDIDNPGTLTVSGNPILLITDHNISIDNPGILTLSADDHIITTEERTSWVNGAKNSTSWNNDNKS